MKTIKETILKKWISLQSGGRGGNIWSHSIIREYHLKTRRSKLSTGSDP